jgi:DNA end-binding protein Ku
MAGQNVSISFGLVNIPVKLHSMVASKYTEGKTHIVHSVCNTQVKAPKWCPKCEKQVDASEQIRGYAYSKTELIPLTPDDLKALPLASTRNLAVKEFVPAEMVDIVALRGEYYLIGPGDDKPNTVKAFSLFNIVMGEKREVGISKISFKETSEHLCLIISGEVFPEYRGQGVMVLQLCPWPSQVKDLSNVGANVPVSEKEKMMAMALIGQLHTESVDLDKYTDQYSEALLALVERKRAGEELSEYVPPIPQEDTSLMDALLASIGQK